MRPPAVPFTPSLASATQSMKTSELLLFSLAFNHWLKQLFLESVAVHNRGSCDVCCVFCGHDAAGLPKSAAG